MKCLVGLSGGLDSTYTAYTLLQAGHCVEGATLIMHAHTDLQGARQSAMELGIPFHEIDCRKEFEEQVIAPFVCAYQNGKTPNPCTLCNRYVKVGVLCTYAETHGFDCVVTGHYAKIGYDQTLDRYYVQRAIDPKKDQSYMLWQLTQEQLALLKTPLCDTEKHIIRQKAQALGFSSADAKESQDICFLPNGDRIAFLQAHLPEAKEGFFLDQTGKVLGKHQGLYHYTVGQRKGLGLSCNAPVFVTALDPIANTVTVCQAEDTYVKGLSASQLCFGALPAPKTKQRLELGVKIRYNAPIVSALVEYDAHTLTLTFSEPQRAVAPGQSVVCYWKDRVAFGGVIDTAFPT